MQDMNEEAGRRRRRGGTGRNVGSKRRWVMIREDDIRDRGPLAMALNGGTLPPSLLPSLPSSLPPSLPPFLPPPLPDQLAWKQASLDT
jgi:hypothetical protein